MGRLNGWRWRTEAFECHVGFVEQVLLLTGPSGRRINLAALM